MISMQRTFGQPVIVPPGNTARIASIGVDVRAQAAAHVGDDVMHVGIGLDAHELIDAHGAGFADSPEVVALEVDQHHVLGALLRMRGELRSLRDIAARPAAARARAGDRPGLDQPVRDAAPDAPARS